MRGLIAAVVMTLAFGLAYAKPLMEAVHPESKERLTLTDEKWECPSGVAPDGTKWDARLVHYYDPRDEGRAKGCYIIDTFDNEHTVIILFKEGPYANRPLILPTKIFKAAI